MAMRKRRPTKQQGALLRFVTRAVSDKSEVVSVSGHRMHREHARAYAEAAMLAVARGRAKGLR